MFFNGSGLGTSQDEFLKPKPYASDHHAQLQDLFTGGGRGGGREGGSRE